MNQTTPSPFCDIPPGHVGHVGDFIPFFRSEYDLDHITTPRIFGGPMTRGSAYKFRFDFARARGSGNSTPGLENYGVLLCGKNFFDARGSDSGVILRRDPAGAGVILSLNSLQRFLVPALTLEVEFFELSFQKYLVLVVVTAADKMQLMLQASCGHPMM